MWEKKVPAWIVTRNNPSASLWAGRRPGGYKGRRLRGYYCQKEGGWGIGSGEQCSREGNTPEKETRERQRREAALDFQGWEGSLRQSPLLPIL